MPHSYRRTWRRVHGVPVNPLSIVTHPYLNNHMDGIRDINWPAGLRSWQVWQVYWKTKTNKQTNKKTTQYRPRIGIGMVQHQNTKHMNDSLNMNIIQHSMKRTKPQRQQHAKVWFLTQTFCKWYDFHFIQRGYESPHMMYWGNRGLRIWCELFQNEMKLFIKGCD